MDFALLGLITGLSGFVGGSFIGYLVNWRTLRELTSVRAAVYSKQGVAAAAQMSDDQQARMAQAVQEYLAMKEQGMDNKQIIMALAPKYMDLAPALMKQFGIKFNLKTLLGM